MTTYVNFKLKTGEDIVGKLTHQTEDSIFVRDSVIIMVHPLHGYFAKSWMMLSEEDEVKISRADLMWATTPNKRAIQYYDEFLHELSKKDKEHEDSREWGTVEEMDEDVERFQDMIEAKMSTKH